MSELASDSRMAILAVQNVRTHFHIFRTAELLVVSAIRNAEMFGANRAELAEIVGEERPCPVARRRQPGHRLERGRVAGRA